MFVKLLALFTIIPVIELMLLIEIGSRIGTLNTIGVILATATAGAYLAKAQGFLAVRRIQDTLARGELPGQALLHGLFILVGGIFLLTPGFLTDVIGLSMLVPPIRQGYIKIAEKYFRDSINKGDWQVRRF